MPEELTNYIKASLAKGTPKDQIHQSLIQAGWRENDIETGFQLLEAPQGLNPSIPSKQIINTVPEIIINKKRSILNSKLFILLGSIIIIASVVIGSSFFSTVKKPDKTNISNIKQIDNRQKTEINLNLSDLKTCENVEPPKLQAPETKLEAKFVFNVKNETKTQVQLLNLNTNEEIILETFDTGGTLRSAYFSPDGKYLVYIVDFYQDQKGNRKFIFFDTITGTKKEIMPTFIVNQIDPVRFQIDQQRIIWSQNSRQFLILQDDFGTTKTGDVNGNYFNVDDLVAHDFRELIQNLDIKEKIEHETSRKNYIPLQYLNKDELILEKEELIGNSFTVSFLKVNLSNGQIIAHISLSKEVNFKVPLTNLITSNLKYYLFVEREYSDPKDLKANIGYVNLENECIKKVNINQFPINLFTTIGIGQISAEENTVLVSILGPEYGFGTTRLAGMLRVDIASLTPRTTLDNPAVNIQTLEGEKISSIEKLSSLFNYMLIQTENKKLIF